jgi:transcriptional regulator with XRE-family HTH domain
MPDAKPAAAALGEFIRTQRRLAGLSLRQVADLARVSNPYLSQLENGKHEPSLRVLLSIAKALDISADALLAEAGVVPEEGDSTRSRSDTEQAIRTDPLLDGAQKEALLTVYRSYLAQRRPPAHNKATRKKRT